MKVIFTLYIGHIFTHF